MNVSKIILTRCQIFIWNFQIEFRLGLCSRLRWGNSRRSPRPPSWIWGKGKGESEGGEEGTGREKCAIVLVVGSALTQLLIWFDLILKGREGTGLVRGRRELVTWCWGGDRRPCEDWNIVYWLQRDCRLCVPSLSMLERCTCYSDSVESINDDFISVWSKTSWKPV